jgi:hypothetical protein
VLVTDLSTRYRGPSTGRRRLTVLGVTVLVVASLGWLVWAMSSHSDPEVTSETVAFEVLDDHTATATFTVVRRSPDVEASCLLRAQAPDHSIVGELNVAVGPGGTRVRRLTETLRTERRATTVEAVGCRTEDQNRLR